MIRRWAIIAADWAATHDGLQALANPRIIAYAASMGEARLLTLRLNKAGDGYHWSIEPVSEEEAADGSPPDRADAPRAQ